LPGPAQRYSAEDGKVEVVEVFSYGCIHCAHFAPMRKAAQELPKGVVFKHARRLSTMPMAAVCACLLRRKQLGSSIAPIWRCSRPSFQIITRSATMDELADFYARQGVNRRSSCASPTVKRRRMTAKLKSDLAS
jgi:thiol:disulfide interchange protein DsbA